MWKKTQIEIGKLIVDAEVNFENDNVEVEILFYDEFTNTDIVKIDKKNYHIYSSKNVGYRDEIIVILLKEIKKDEHKQVEVRDKIKV